MLRIIVINGMKSTERELKRLRYKFLNKIVDTRAVKDFKNSIEVLGRNIGPFIAGNHYRMEYWAVKPFLKHDILELTDREKLDVQKIQKLAFTESRASQIEKIDENLFFAIREYLDILKSKNQQDRRFRDVYSNVQDLISVRLGKIGSLSQAKQTMRLIQNLTAEEKVLIEKLSTSFREWNKFFLEDVKKKN